MKTKSISVVLAMAGAAFRSAGARAQEPINIGVLTPLSGTYAPIGQQVRLGA